MTRDETGSVAEEAAKLFAALKGPAGDTAAHDGEARECQWCPVCQLIRRVGPEVVEQVVASVRGLLDAVAAAAKDAGKDAGKAPDEPPRVDRIDVSEDPERWD